MRTCSVSALICAFSSGVGKRGARIRPAAAEVVDVELSNLRQRLLTYQDAGVDHVLIEPFERDLEAWLAAVDRIAQAGREMLS